MTSNLTCQAKDIGYFDPALRGNSPYKDVFEFKQRIETCVIQWSDQAVRNVIASCLQGDALKWYSTELHEDAKKLLSRALSSTEWTERLVKRFKRESSSALAIIRGTKYTIIEIKRGVLARQYATDILRLSKHAEIHSVRDQLDYIYYNVASEFQRDLKLPTKQTTIDEFLEELDTCQETWNDRFLPRRRYQPFQSRERQTMPSKARDWPLQKTTYQFKTPYYGSNLAASLGTQQPKQSHTQPAIEAAPQVAPQVKETPFEKTLKIAISTPLPTTFECRHCWADFSSNNQLHKHIREDCSATKSKNAHKSGSLTHSTAETPCKPTAAIAASENAPTATMRSATKRLEPPKMSVLRLKRPETTRTVPTSAPTSVAKSIAPPNSSLLARTSAESTTSEAIVTIMTPSPSPLPAYRAVSPSPPEYRALSPSPPAYEAPKKPYLTVQDLYERFATPKHMAPKLVTKAVSFLTIQDLYARYKHSERPASYLTVQDLYEKFHQKRHRKVSIKAASIEKNTGNAVCLAKQSPCFPIRPSAIKSVHDSKTSPFDLVSARNFSAKTPLLATKNRLAQSLST